MIGILYVHLGHLLEKKSIDEKWKISAEVMQWFDDNDIEVAKIAGLAIAFNPKESSLPEACDVLIQNNDLREILKYIE